MYSQSSLLPSEHAESEREPLVSHSTVQRSIPKLFIALALCAAAVLATRGLTRITGNGLVAERERRGVRGRGSGSAASYWAFATTTQFGEGEKVWPNAGSDNWYLPRINARSGPWHMTTQSFPDGTTAIRAGRTGAAIPWPIVMNYDFPGGQRGRKAWIQSATLQAQGQLPGSQPLCYMVQPMKSGTSPYTPDGQLSNFDDNTLLATSKTGENYVYLIAPFEGCGGDAQNAVLASDCFNSCPDVQMVVNSAGIATDQWKAAMNQLCASPDPKCAPVCSLWNGTGFTVITPTTAAETPASGYNFVKGGSCTIGVSLATDYMRTSVQQGNNWVMSNWDVNVPASSSCGHINYCSGANAHFDIAASSDGFGFIWLDQYDAANLQNSFGDGSGSNILMRWTPASCDVWGSWTPGLQSCSAKFCSQCAYNQPSVCEQCVSGSSLLPNGTCTDMPYSGDCSLLGLPDDNVWLNSFCHPSWNGYYAPDGSSCPSAISFCNCLDTIKLWNGNYPPAKEQVDAYMAANCTDQPATTAVPAPETSTSSAPPSPPSPPGPIVENVDMPAEVISCQDEKWQPVKGYWSYGQIADAFYTFASALWNYDDTLDAVGECVSALTIVAGECNPGTNPELGCSAASTGPSGVFQTDFLRTIPGYPSQAIMPLCTSAWGAGFMAYPFWATADEQHVNTVSYLQGTAASFYACAGAQPYVNNYSACPDPQSVPGVEYTNFIGSFCHKSGFQRWSPCDYKTNCCSLFNGGGNSYQVPFPQYYLDKATEAQTSIGADFTSICTAFVPARGTS